MKHMICPLPCWRLFQPKLHLQLDIRKNILRYLLRFGNHYEYPDYIVQKLLLFQWVLIQMVLELHSKSRFDTKIQKCIQLLRQTIGPAAWFLARKFKNWKNVFWLLRPKWLNFLVCMILGAKILILKKCILIFAPKIAQVE